MNKLKLILASIVLLFNLNVFGQIVQSSTPNSVESSGTNISWWYEGVASDFVAALQEDDNSDVLTEVCANACSDTLFFGDFDFNSFDPRTSLIYLNITKRRSGSPLTDAYLVATYNGQVISDNLADVSTAWPDQDSTFTYVLDDSALQLSLDANILSDESFGFLLKTTPSDPFCMNAHINSARLFVMEDDIHSTLVADAGPDLTINCLSNQVALGGENTSVGSEFSYVWSDEFGVILGSSRFLTVDQDGIYTLAVTNTTNGQVASDMVVVAEDFDIPDAVISIPETLNCLNSSAILNATGSTEGANISYEWMNSSFSLISTELSPEVFDCGEYILIVTNLDNGCSSQASVIVECDIEEPQVSIDNPGLLPIGGSIQLSANGSSVGIEFVYEWFTNNGEITAGSSTLNPTVSTVGEYCLIITNQFNGCSNTGCIIVEQASTSSVIADAGVDQNFNCSIDTILLGGPNTSIGAEFEYAWIFRMDTVSTEPFFSTTSAGPYILNVTNLQTNETASDTVILGATFEFIGLSIANQGELSCASPTMTLSVFTELFYFEETSTLWNTTNGSIISDPTQNTITISQAGVYTVVVTNLSSGCTGMQTIAVDSDGSLPTVSIASPEVLTCENLTTLLDGSNSSSGPEYSYEWYDSNFGIVSNSPITEVDLCGVYTLIVTNTSNGCESLGTVVVDCELTLPNVIIATPDLLSPGATVQLDGSQSELFFAEFVTYEWSTKDGTIVSGQNDNIAVVSAAGTYCLTITNLENGCFSTACVEVQQGNMITVIADAGPDQTINCETNVVVIGGSNSSMGPEFTFEWFDEVGNIVGTTLFLEVFQPGNYTLSVTNINNGEFDTDQVQVSQDITIPSVSITLPGVLTCINNVVVIEAIVSSTGDIGYSWINSAGDIISNASEVPVSEPGTYTVEVTDLTNGCFTAESVQVIYADDKPVLVIDDPILLDCDNFATIDPSTFTEDTLCVFSWIPREGLTVNPDDPFTIKVDSSGTYSLVKVDTLSSCEIAYVFNIIVPDKPVADAGPDQAISCSFIQGQPLGGPLTSMGSNYSYSWFTADGDIFGPTDQPTAIPVSVGLYTLEVTDLSTGCVATDDVLVTELALPSIQIMSTISCDGTVEVAVLVTDGTPPYDIDWLPFDPNMNPVAGTYEVTVTDASDCLVIESFTIPEINELTLDLVINANGEIEAVVTGGALPYTYDWGNGITGPIIDNPVAGTEYTVTIVDANGCEVTSSIIYQPNAVSQTSARQLRLYPNPTQESLTIELENISYALQQLDVIDVQGRRMEFSNTFTDQNTMQLFLRNCLSGAYFLQAIIDDQLYYQKIVVIN